MKPEWIFSIVWCIASVTLIFTMDLWIDSKFGKAIQSLWGHIERGTNKMLSPITRRF